MENVVLLLATFITALPALIVSIAGWRRARAAHREVLSANGSTTGVVVEKVYEAIIDQSFAIDRLTRAVEASLRDKTPGNG